MAILNEWVGDIETAIINGWADSEMEMPGIYLYVSLPSMFGCVYFIFKFHFSLWVLLLGQRSLQGRHFPPLESGISAVQVDVSTDFKSEVMPLQGRHFQPLGAVSISFFEWWDLIEDGRIKSQSWDWYDLNSGEQSLNTKVRRLSRKVRKLRFKSKMTANNDPDRAEWFKRDITAICSETTNFVNGITDFVMGIQITFVVRLQILLMGPQTLWWEHKFC